MAGAVTTVIDRMDNLWSLWKGMDPAEIIRRVINIRVRGEAIIRKDNRKHMTKTALPLLASSQTWQASPVILESPMYGRGATRNSARNQ